MPNKEIRKMHDESKTQDNINRLLRHLKKDSLAAHLVQAHHTPETGDPAESMKAVLRKRLEQVKEDLDGTQA
jgi:hypothetical protein